MRTPIQVVYTVKEPYRWFPFDQYPRARARRILRRKKPMRGMRKVVQNLLAGLQRLGMPYSLNARQPSKRDCRRAIGFIGEREALRAWSAQNPLVVGPAVVDHPLDDPSLVDDRRIKRIVVASAWLADVFVPYWGSRVAVWPVGIDTVEWGDCSSAEKTIDVLIYDKLSFRPLDVWLLAFVQGALREQGITSAVIRYGFYEEEDFHRALGASRAMLFLSHWEGQGIAYQEALSTNTPVLAWDRKRWDPGWMPYVAYRKGQEVPATSVPYFDDRCGATFSGVADFQEAFAVFWSSVQRGAYRPREYVLEELTLERRSAEYVRILEECE
jgi:hypothetical protein